MKTIILILFLTLSLNLVAQTKNSGITKKLVKSETEKSNFFSYANLGLSYPETSSRDNSKKFGSKLIYQLDLGVRYAILNKTSLNLEIGKLFTNGNFSNDTGNLSYSLGVGLTFALSGNLVSESTTNTYLLQKQVSKDGKTKILSQTRKINKKNDFDGIRIGINIAQLDFSKIDDAVYGYSGSIYYEARIKESNALQFGLKYNGINHQKVKANILQAFIGFGFLP